MHDTSDRKDIRKAEKRVALAERERIEFLQHSLATSAGRNWFHEFLSACHLFSDPFTNNPYLEAYNKGERNVGLRIFADIIAHCPDQYILMMREASTRSVTNGRRNDDDNRSSADELDGSPDSGRDVEGSGYDDLDPATGYPSRENIG